MSDVQDKYNLGRVTFIVGSRGGDISAYDPDPESGEVFWTMGLTPGRHEAKQFADLLQPGWLLRAEKGVFAHVDGKQRARANALPDNALNTDANRDYRPRIASAQQVMLMQMAQQLSSSDAALRRMEAQTQTLAATVAAQQAARAPAPAPAPAELETEATAEETPNVE